MRVRLAGRATRVIARAVHLCPSLGMHILDSLVFSKVLTAKHVIQGRRTSKTPRWITESQIAHPREEVGAKGPTGFDAGDASHPSVPQKSDHCKFTPTLYAAT